MNIVGIAGSIRQKSFNRALLEAATELAPRGMEIQQVALDDIPLYNSDLDESFDNGPFPPAVDDLKRRVGNSDGVLLVSPEYNWGPSGVVKNAIDWLSRPANASPLHHKPVALMGTSPGPAGTGRAQLQMRQWLQSTRSHVLLEPDVQLGGSGKIFDDDLRLIDPDARGLVARQLEAFAFWVELHGDIVRLDEAKEAAAGR